MSLHKFLNRFTVVKSLRIFVFLILGQSYSQQIYVRDEITSESLPDVIIYNENRSKSIITDNRGAVNLDIFSDNEKNVFLTI